MSRKRTISPPSILHAARLAADSREEVCAAFVQEFLSRAPFNYKLLDKLAWLRQKHGISLDQLNAAVRAYQPVESFQRNFLEVTPLLAQNFGTKRSTYVIAAESFTYPIDDLHLPFRPPFAFEDEGKMIVPVPIYWRENPLVQKQYSLFLTLASELLQQHPDYAEAALRIYSFSALFKKGPRVTAVHDASAFPLLSNVERDRMLLTLLQGYRDALAEIEKLLKQRDKSTSLGAHGPQLDIFGPDES